MITVALPPGVGYVLAPPLIERFSAKYPNVSVKCTGGYSNQLYEALIRGRVDIACIHDPLPRRDMEVIPLLRQEVFAVGKAGSFPKTGGDLTSEDLEKLPLILPTSPNASRKLLDAWAAAGGSWIEAKFEIDDHVIMSGLIKRGLGFGLMTQATISANLRVPGVEIRSLAPKAYWPLALAYFKPRMVSDPQRDFIAMTIAMVDQMKAGGEWSGDLARDSDSGQNRMATSALQHNVRLKNRGRRK
jgi:LysR family nitrogen assimilation transcriptional regulator